MHTRELIRRLIRQTASRELDTAPVEVISDLIDVANTALTEVWSRMPAELKNVPVTTPLAAPASVSVTPYNGSRWAGGMFSDWIGCAIQYPDDPAPNRLVSANSLERPHVGNPANDGSSQTALVWHDAVHLDEFTTVLGDGIFVEIAGQHSQLTPWKYKHPISAQLDVSPNTPAHFDVIPTGSAPIVDTLRRRTDIPQLIDSPPGWFLQVVPRPSAAAVLRYMVSIHGERITIADYRRDTRLRIPDRMESYLMAIAGQGLAATRLWVGDPVLRQAVNDRAELARRDLATIVHSNVEPGGGIGTPVGW